MADDKQGKPRGWAAKIASAPQPNQPLSYGPDELPVRPIDALIRDPAVLKFDQGPDSIIEPSLRIFRDVIEHKRDPIAKALVQQDTGMVHLPNLQSKSHPNRYQRFFHGYRNNNTGFPLRLRGTEAKIIWLEASFCDGTRALSTTIEPFVQQDLDQRIGLFCEHIAKVYHIDSLDYRIFIPPEDYRDEHDKTIAVILAASPTEQKKLDLAIKALKHMEIDLIEERICDANGANLDGRKSGNTPKKPSLDRYSGQWDR